MALQRRCLVEGCPAFTTRTRCSVHEASRLRAREMTRGSRHERGYDARHDAARAALARRLPAPCGYCGRMLYPDERWVAAHVVDGVPSAGYVPAHPECNQRAIVRSR